MTEPFWTPETRADLAERMKAGYSDRRIAELLGRTELSVRQARLHLLAHEALRPAPPATAGDEPGRGRAKLDGPLKPWPADAPPFRDVDSELLTERRDGGAGPNPRHRPWSCR